MIIIRKINPRPIAPAISDVRSASEPSFAPTTCEDSSVSVSGRTVTGTIKETSVNYTVKYNNIHETKDITLTKHTGYFEKYPNTKTQERTWKTKADTFEKLLLENEIVAEKDKYGEITIYEKYRIDKGQVIKTHWDNKRYNAINYGTNILEALIEKGLEDIKEEVKEKALASYRRQQQEPKEEKAKISVAKLFN